MLLTEYRLATEVSGNIDTLRNVLTSFFITVNGAVLVVTSLVLQGQIKNHALGSPDAFLAAMQLAVAVLGALFVATIARMRRIQLERYHIANRILDHVLRNKGERQLIPYADNTLPSKRPPEGVLGKRTSGSYLWTLVVILPSSVLAGVSLGLYLGAVNARLEGPADWAVGTVGAMAAFVGCDQIYNRLSVYRAPAAIPVT